MADGRPHRFLCLIHVEAVLTRFGSGAAERLWDGLVEGKSVGGGGDWV